MASNRNAVLAKLAKRGGSQAVARARTVVTRNPHGKLAARLASVAPYTRINPAKRDAQNVRGAKQARATTARVFADARVHGDMGLAYLKSRAPGSPY